MIRAMFAMFLAISCYDFAMFRKPDKIVGFGQRCHDPDKDARRTIRLTSTPNFNDIRYLVGKKNVALFLLISL